MRKVGRSGKEEIYYKLRCHQRDVFIFSKQKVVWVIFQGCSGASGPMFFTCIYFETSEN